MMPPTLLNVPNLELIAEDVAATSIEVIKTIVEWTSEMKVTTVTGR